MVRKALESLPGVTKVEIDFGGKLASCVAEPEKFNVSDALKALADVGY